MCVWGRQTDTTVGHRSETQGEVLGSAEQTVRGSLCGGGAAGLRAERLVSRRRIHRCRNTSGQFGDEGGDPREVAQRGSRSWGKLRIKEPMFIDQEEGSHGAERKKIPEREMDD